MTNDYKSTLEGFEEAQETITIIKGHEAYNAIVFALKLTDKVCGEPSEGMLNKVIRNNGVGPLTASDVFSKMIAQAIKEIEKT